MAMAVQRIRSTDQLVVSWCALQITYQIYNLKTMYVLEKECNPLFNMAIRNTDQLGKRGDLGKGKGPGSINDLCGCQLGFLQ
jgi:hypothetical protein